MEIQIKKEFNKWLQNRKLGKLFLCIECVYAVILLLTLLFNFPLFTHLVIFQGIFVLVYLLIGLFFGKKTAKITNKNRETIKEKISAFRIRKLTIIRFFEVIVFLVAVFIAIMFFRQLWLDIFQKPIITAHSALIENATLYADLAYTIFLLGLATNILSGNKKLIRIFSLLVLFVSLILFLLSAKLIVLIGLWVVVSVAGLCFSYIAKI